MNNKVLHKGVVKQISGNQLIIAVLQQASCSDCRAKDVCKIPNSHSDRREITVSVTDSTVYSVGESVCVSMSAGLGMKAVWLVFGYPLLLALACVVLVKMFGGTDPLAVATVLVAEFLWYVTLFFSRHRLENNYKFNIERIID